MVGTVGEVAVVRNVPDYAIKNVALFKCGGSELKGKWLAYYLKTPTAKAHMFGQQRGSSQQFIALSQLRKMPVLITDRSYMRRTVDILSAYDELIENNHKQIALLEEAAQRLYHEWFVDFRFPGHENTSFVDGLPSGWKKCSILSNDIFVFAKSTVKPFDGTKTYYATADVNGTEITGTGETVTFDKRPSRAGIQPFRNSVWFARMSNSYKVLNCFGANLHLADTAIISTGFAGFTSRKNCYGFVYETIASDTFNNQKDRYATGATQVSLTNEGLKKIQVQIPTLAVIEKYSLFAEPLMAKAELLKRENYKLALGRDLFLVRLINPRTD